MSKLKVLQLEFWMKYEIDQGHTTYVHQIGKSKIGRDGWYFQNGQSWFEYCGHSYDTYGLAESFKFNLKLLNTVILTDEQEANIRKLLKTIGKHKADMKKQLIRALYDSKNAKELRETRRAADKQMMKFKKVGK